MYKQQTSIKVTPSVEDLTDSGSLLVSGLVFNELQSADELGGPDTPLEYIKLMSCIAGECLERARVCANNNIGSLAKEELPPILVPQIMLSMLIDLATEQVQDIESGIEEGIYDPSDNPDINKKRALVDLAETLYRQVVYSHGA